MASHCRSVCSATPARHGVSSSPPSPFPLAPGHLFPVSFLIIPHLFPPRLCSHPRCSSVTLLLSSNLGLTRHFSFTSFSQSPHQRIRWLTQGSVEFQDVELVYRPGLPNALDGVTFRVEPGEKLGIVGRTGSGKSSVFLVLFRLLEPSAGRVLLDGVDTSQLELAELRSGVRRFGRMEEGRPLGRCKTARANGQTGKRR